MGATTPTVSVSSRSISRIHTESQDHWTCGISAMNTSAVPGSPHRLPGTLRDC